MADIVLKLLYLLFGLIIVGTITCLPLYKWKFGQLLHSNLFIKIVMWIPIYLVLICVVLVGKFAATALAVGIVAVIAVEVMRQKAYMYWLVIAYAVLVSISVLSIPLWFFVGDGIFVTFFIGVTLTSVLSDVVAFFVGNYFGFHKLPKFINNRKSWEGVAGQFAGAVIGAFLSCVVLEVALPTSVVLTVAIGSAVGDVFNSVAKRLLGIKDWSNFIAGHGGFLDRLSSLSFALSLSLINLLIIYVV